MKKAAKLLYDKIEDIAEKNIANQFVIPGEIRKLVTDADNETLQAILEDVTKRLNTPGWGSMKAAIAGIKFALDDVLSERAEKS